MRTSGQGPQETSGLRTRRPRAHRAPTATDVEAEGTSPCSPGQRRALCSDVTDRLSADLPCEAFSAQKPAPLDDLQVTVIEHL